MEVKFDFSGLERLEKVMKKIGGQKRLEYECQDGEALEKADLEELAEETIQHLLGDEKSQKTFVSGGTFSYRSKILRSVTKVTLAPR